MLPYTNYAETRFVPDPQRRLVWTVIAEYLQRYIPVTGNVLELGSGYCDFINAIRAGRRWALDLHIDPARHVAGGVLPLHRDVADLQPIEPEELDTVFASNLFEHLGDEKLVQATRGVVERLRPGGRLILIQPNYRYCYRRYFDDYTHCRVFTHVSLPDFLRAQGLEVERVDPRFLPFSMRSRIPKWRFLVWLYLRLPWRPIAGQMLVIARKPGPDPGEP